MRVLLVRPARMKQAITLGEFMFCEPLGLECVAGVLKDSHTVRILDLMVENVAIEKICDEWRPDAVGLTSLCIDVPGVIALARRIKAHDPAIITVAGGTQAYFAPESFQDDAIDHVFAHTTRANLLALFAHLASGSAVPPLDGVRSRALAFAATGAAGRNEYLVPDRKSTAAYRRHYSYFGYRPCAIMQTSQGCSRHCAFCLRWRLEGPCEEAQPMALVLRQIREISEPNIMILDNDLFNDGPRLHELCDGLERAGIRKNFICYGSVRSLLANREAVARFARNGLRATLIGYESFSARDLDQYRKATAPDDNLAAAACLRALGVDAWASFILHPDWDAADFREFRRYLRALRPQVASMSPLTPFLPLPLFESYEHRIMFARSDYEKWSFSQVTIRPGRMTLRRYYYEMLKSNLYINLFTNNLAYMVSKFGPGTVLRLLLGSLRIMGQYLRLMRAAKEEPHAAEKRPQR